MFGISKHKPLPAILQDKDLDEYNKQYTEPFGETGHDGRNNIILSQDMFLSMDTQKTQRNTHVCVISGTGSENYNYIAPNLLQANSSYVVSDPGGVLFRGYSKYLEYMGYKVKCLNLIQMDQGNHYNPFRYIHGDKDVVTLVDALLENTVPPERCKGKMFFRQAERSILSALVAFLHQCTTQDQQNFYNIMRLLRTIKLNEDGSADYSQLDIIFEELRGVEPELFAVKLYDDFRMYTGENLADVLFSCEIRLQAFNLWDVAELTKTDDIDLEAVGDEKTALFIILPAGDSAFNFIAAMMYSQLFQTIYEYCETTAPFTQVVLDRDGQIVKTFRANNEAESIEKAKEAKRWLDFAKAAKIIPQKDMGWYELVMDNGEMAAFRGSRGEAQKALDLLQEGRVIANSEMTNGGYRLPIHVRMLLNKFAYIRQIPWFEKIVATSRKYELSVDIILQSIAQLKNLYKDNWPDIAGNCDTLLYLGGADMETREWLANCIERQMETGNWIASLLGKKKKAGTSASHDNIPKKIRNLAEDKCIVIHRGFSYTGKKYETSLHPMWRLAKDLGPYAFSEEKRQRLSSGEWGVAEEQEERPTEE